MDLEQAEPQDILAWTYENFERPVLVASFQVESCVLIHMAAAVQPGAQIITIDTGRLPEETLTTIEAVRQRYQVEINVIRPDPVKVAQMTYRHGSDLFYRSVDFRQLCCSVRKAEPLEAALRGHDAWVTGLRRDQGATRAATPIVTSDPIHGGIAKIAPLARWTQKQVWRFVELHQIPYNRLYDQGYTSIGCAPCTRAVEPGEDERAGRWWWEVEAVKECGIHWADALTPSGDPQDLEEAAGC